MTPAGYLRPRARLVARFGLFGALLGGVGVLLLVTSGEAVAFASRTAFSVGALVFGLALLGWSGSVFAGGAIENMQKHLGSNSDWTEADSRRAMAVLGSLGGGGMVGSSVMTIVLNAAF